MKKSDNADLGKSEILVEIFNCSAAKKSQT
jgi:hypothetical protein